jgi:hypothetical protein
MGTNYYFCSQEPLELELDEGYNAYHIGKRSAGWQFTFRGHENGPGSMRDWITLFETTPGHVMNEYGEEFDVMTFMQDIVKPTKGRRISSPLALGDWVPPSFFAADEMDDDGWHVICREFC